MSLGKFLALGGFLAAVGLTACALAQESNQRSTQPFVVEVPAPKLVGKPADWLNTDGKRLEFQKGKVTIVHFWTFG